MINKSTILAEALEGKSFDFNEIDEGSDGFLSWLTFCDEGGLSLEHYHEFLTDITKSEHIYQFAVRPNSQPPTNGSGPSDKRTTHRTTRRLGKVFAGGWGHD